MAGRGGGKSKKSEDGEKTRMAAIKKGALRLLKKIIVLVFEALNLLWVVETFEKII